MGATRPGHPLTQLIYHGKIKAQAIFLEKNTTAPKNIFPGPLDFLRLMITNISAKGCCLNIISKRVTSRPKPRKGGPPRRQQSQVDCFGPEEGRYLKMGIR